MATTQTRAPIFYTVDPGTPAVKCSIGAKTCTKSIYFVRTKAGKMMPVDCDVEGGIHPSPTKDPAQGDAFSPNGLADIHPGRGVPHFGTCPDYR